MNGAKIIREKLKAVTAALAAIEKQFGKGAIMPLSAEAAEVAVVPTGSLALDAALGTLGLPRGRVIEIFGPESSGKTTLMLHAIAEAQRQGGVCAFIDAEHALDASYARRLGVRLEELLVAQPDCGEQALEIADALVRSGGVDLIVVDSVAALVPRAEIDGEMGENHLGLQARLMSQALRKLTAVAAKQGTAVVFINQLRMKIGVAFGSPETTPGGQALKFYASVRLDIRRSSQIKQGEEVVGMRARVKVVKNKLAPPFREAELEILYGSGINRAGELLDLAVERGLMEKSGAWYALDGERVAQGRERACDWLRDHAEVAERLRERLIPLLRAPAAEASPGHAELAA
ncbi:MAG: recombinase RecA [Myxococcales bacterium]|nr:recombinase RecA [Myxococcota bacterium]MDW8281668.1 recombinase RecA [Myxococcales bacterium]